MSQAVLDRKLPKGTSSRAEWCFRHGGNTYGPYDCETLREVILAGGIDSGLELRQGPAGDWFKISAVERMLERIEAGLPPIAETGTATPSPQNRKSAIQHCLATAQPTSVAALKAPSSRQACRVRQSFLEALGRKQLTILVVMFSVWLAVDAVVVGSYSGSHATEKNYLREIQSVWDEFHESRRESVSDAEWSALQVHADQKLAPIIRDLKKSADTKTPVRQHLLWAARDYLPKTLQTARKGPNAAEELFEKHMEEARRLLGPSR